jgi:hypothetical protein
MTIPFIRQRRSDTAGCGVSDADIENEVLRMLWTFHWASTAQLTRLVWGHNTGNYRTRLRPALERLYMSDLVWRTSWRFLPGYRAQQRGATERGKARAAESLPELSTLHCVTREDYLSATERRTLLHSGHYTEYCTGLIEELRHHPLTAGLFFETECTLLGRHLRMDGLIRVRLHRTPPIAVGAPTHDPWFVPWQSGLRELLHPSKVDLTFALEIDEGTEQLSVLHRKAQNYKRTYLGGVQLLDAMDKPTIQPVAWDQVLCPPNMLTGAASRTRCFPVTIVVVNGPQRLSNVMDVWQQGWGGSEVRMTSWRHINEAGSIVRAPYRNQHGAWVDLTGHPHPYTGRLPPPRP